MNAVDPQLDFSTCEPDGAWSDEAAKHPQSTVFHSAAWAEVLRRTYGHRLSYARFAENGATTALIPLAEVRSWVTGCRGVSLPFTDACEPLVFEERAGRFETLCAFGRSRGWSQLELRGEKLLPRDARPATEFVAHELDLAAGADRVLRGCAPAVRRALRKAESSHLAVEIGTSIEVTRAYYKLHQKTRRRQGAPPQPWPFFRNLQACLLETGLGFVVLAKCGDRPVAGAVFLHAGRKAVYKFGAADLAFQELRPSNLVMSTAIRHLAERGFASLHFGRTSLSNEGLRRFKKGWGALELPIRYYRHDLRARRWMTSADRASGAHNHFFRRWRLCVNRGLGALL
jgi:CelD/BcsL family acetyltransferase involved in cellulose biosynthesis